MTGTMSIPVIAAILSLAFGSPTAEARHCRGHRHHRCCRPVVYVPCSKTTCCETTCGSNCCISTDPCNTGYNSCCTTASCITSCCSESCCNWGYLLRITGTIIMVLRNSMQRRHMLCQERGVFITGLRQRWCEVHTRGLELRTSRGGKCEVSFKLTGLV